MRLMRLCHKYGYDEMALILKRRIERARQAQLAQGTPILQNLRGVGQASVEQAGVGRAF